MRNLNEDGTCAFCGKRPKLKPTNDNMIDACCAERVMFAIDIMSAEKEGQELFK